jgi:hypothetical protein
MLAPTASRSDLTIIAMTQFAAPRYRYTSALMDDFVKDLLELRNNLRHRASCFCDFVETNGNVITPDEAGAVRNMIEATIVAIEDIPIA